MKINDLALLKIFFMSGDFIRLSRKPTHRLLLPPQ